MTLPGSQLELLLIHPGWLLLLPLVLLVFLAAWFKPGLFRSPEDTQGSPQSSGSGLLVRHPLIGLVETAERKIVKRSFNGLLYAIAVALMLLSLSEPVLQGKQLPDLPQERDIVFLIDASISMVLRDYLLEGKRVDRMSLLKGVLDRMVQRLEGDRIGIIVFGEHAYTLAPLTRDQHLLREMLVRIKPTVAGRFSSIAEAVVLALKQINQAHNSDEERRRILVLFSAAASHTGINEDLAAATLAEEMQVPIYTVAVGAASHSAAEQRKGELIYEPADLERLNQLATQTGGLSFRAGDNAAFDKALNDIELRETNKRELPPRFVTYPLYQWPLLFSLLLLTLGPLIKILRGQE